MAILPTALTKPVIRCGSDWNTQRQFWSRFHKVQAASYRPLTLAAVRRKIYACFVCCVLTKLACVALCGFLSICAGASTHHGGLAHLPVRVECCRHRTLFCF